MQKHRVVHFVSGLGKDSGVMSVIMNYYRHVDRNNIQFDFISFINCENSYEAEILSMGGRVFFCPNPRNIILFIKFIHKFIKHNFGRYVAIHIHEVYMATTIGAIAKLHGFQNIIVHSHATRYSDKSVNAIRNSILCLGINKFARYRFACSIAAGSFLYGKNNFTVINNAIELHKFKFDSAKRARIRAELDIDEEEVLLGNIGRLCEQKNHLFLLDVFHDLIMKNPKFKLLLVGDGPLFPKVSERILSLGLQNKVVCVGKRTNVEDFLCAMDMFILPSIFEGLPIVGLEAQASGLPVVFSDDITSEIEVINCTFLSLAKGSQYWAECISNVNFKISDRENSYMLVSENSNFDINKETQKLVDIYLRMWEKR